MDNIDHLFDRFVSVIALGVELERAQPLFDEAGHQTTHRSAGSGDPLQKDGAIWISDQGTLNRGQLPLNAP